jgi:hypothetical protein
VFYFGTKSPLTPKAYISVDVDGAAKERAILS